MGSVCVAHWLRECFPAANFYYGGEIIQVTNLTFVCDGSTRIFLRMYAFKSLLILQEILTILFVEHDKVFCDNIATKVVRL